MNELYIKKTLDELDEQVVQRAEAVVKHYRGIEKHLEDSQVRNVLSVAEETESVAVVDNFIKYQIGRNKEGEKWRFGEKDKKRFGDAVREDLEWLKELARKAKGEKVSAEDLTIRLVRRYLGYLIRYFKYASIQ